MAETTYPLLYAMLHWLPSARLQWLPLPIRGGGGKGGAINAAT